MNKKKKKEKKGKVKGDLGSATVLIFATIDSQ